MSAGVAANAIRLQQEALQKEEEDMTKYSDADLQGEWEFKIVRANTRAFGKSEVFRQVCSEEAKAGWILVEKFDDSRIRFKRLVSARAGDAALELDPYRTHYGISPAAAGATLIAFSLGVALVAVVSVIAIVLLMVQFVKK